MLWTDNMMIPKHAKNPYNAHLWMNYYYQPNIAARVAETVAYITPVPDARGILLKAAPGVAKSALVFPTAEMTAKVRNYPTFRTRQEFDSWNGIFNPIITG